MKKRLIYIVYKENHDVRWASLGSWTMEQKRLIFMMYPYATLNADTEITYSGMQADGKVKVYIETPDSKDGFHSATCYLPEYIREDVNSY